MTSPAPIVLQSCDLMRLLPHRYPMLLIDRLEHIIPNEQAVGVKNVTINEPFFVGHFPGHPVMPGVLIIEALAQTAGALVMHSLGISHVDHVVYFMSITEARFRHPVVPGDRLHLHVKTMQRRQMVWKFQGEARVDGELHSEATFTAQMARTV